MDSESKVYAREKPPSFPRLIPLLVEISPQIKGRFPHRKNNFAEMPKVLCGTIIVRGKEKSF